MNPAALSPGAMRTLAREALLLDARLPKEQPHAWLACANRWRLARDLWRCRQWLPLLARALTQAAGELEKRRTRRDLSVSLVDTAMYTTRIHPAGPPLTKD